MPAEQLERNGVDPEALKPIIDASAPATSPRASSSRRPEIADKLSFSGTPRR
jgi:5,10-methylenetetrahydromethanopterin reductase